MNEAEDCKQATSVIFDRELSVMMEYLLAFSMLLTHSQTSTYTPLVFTLRLHNYFFMLFAFLSVPFQIVI
jgi:hypothetical protein